MSLTEYERRELASIARAVAQDDPELADRLSRMAPVSRAARRLTGTAVGTLLACGLLLIGADLTVHQPVCLAGAVLAGAAAVAVGAGWRWRLRRARPRTGPPRFPAAPPALDRH